MAQAAMKSRATSLVSRALNHPEGNDAPVTLELCDLIRRGGSVEVMEALKDPLKHQPPAVQLKALGCVNALVANSGADFAVYLSGEEWMERFYGIAKSSASTAVRDNIIRLVIQWSRRLATAGFRHAQSRFANSKSLGEHYGRISQEIDNDQRARARVGGGGGGGPGSRQTSAVVGQQNAQQAQQASLHRQTSQHHVDPGAAVAESRRKERMILSNLEAFLLEAQSDLANLEYALEHPGMGDLKEMARDCDRHLRRCQTTLQQDLPEEGMASLLQLSESLHNVIDFYRVLEGSAEDEPPHAAPPPAQRPAPRQVATNNAPPQGNLLAPSVSTGGQLSGEVTPDPQAGEEGEEGNDPEGDMMRQQSSMHAQRELAQMQVEAQTVKMLEEERKETQNLREELSKRQEELERQQNKYKEAKKKNQKAVDAASELVEKLENAEAQIADLKAGKMEADERAAVPPPEPQIIKVVERPTVDKNVILAVHNNISSIKRSFRGLRDDVSDLKKELVVTVGRVSSSVNHIVSASEADRAGDLKALKWTQDLYRKEQKLRKQYYNTIQDLKGNIRVYCRIRPMSKTELSGGHENCVTFPNEEEVRLVDDKGKVRNFEFDCVFTPTSTQMEVFRDTAPLIDSVVDGYNVCIFAYGQTGSGKTHTMTGYEQDKGINKRAIDRLFNIIHEREETETSSVHVSVVEVYCEQLHDLLKTKAQNAAISLDVKTNGPFGNYVNNLSEQIVNCADDIDTILDVAQGNRSEGKTNMNEHSSRSHMLLYVRVETENKQTGVKSYGKLSLVDLAGSERLDKSQATGQAAKEAAAINKSLSALGDVIAGLSSQAKHVPFRNSQLTFLLQDSMMGQAKVLMFCCASPASYNASETNTALQFATRARGVSLGPIKKNAAH